MKWIKKMLCKAGLHHFGKCEITRYDPALKMSVYHSHCSCGLNKCFKVYDLRKPLK